MIVREGTTAAADALVLPKLGYGGGSLFTLAEEREATDLASYGYGRGFRYFDTAPLYANGLGEHWFGTALRQRPRGDFILSTKVGRRLQPDRSVADTDRRFAFAPFYDYSYDGAMRSLDDSLQRLGLARVDIALLHDVNVRWHGADYERRFGEAMDGAYRALERLRSEGVVRAIGVGVKGADVCARFAGAGDFDCFMLAGGYTLLEHAALDALFPVCAAKRIAVIVASPFNSGVLATGVTAESTYFYEPPPPEIAARVGRLEAICRRHGVPLGAAALQFTLAHPVVVSAVCGYRHRREVDANLEWAEFAIPGALWDELRAERLIPGHAPPPPQRAIA